MRTSFIITILFLSTLSLSAQSARQKNGNMLEKLIKNKWQGEGQLMRGETRFKMNWSQTLNNKFYELAFQSSRKAKNNQHVLFKARAFYKVENDSLIAGTWFDNRGVIFPLKGKLNTNHMTIHWGSDTTERGKTIYSYIENSKEITVEDFAMNKGKYFKFANATYTKAK